MAALYFADLLEDCDIDILIPRWWTVSDDDDDDDASIEVSADWLNANTCDHRIYSTPRKEGIWDETPSQAVKRKQRESLPKVEPAPPPRKDVFIVFQYTDRELMSAGTVRVLDGHAAWFESDEVTAKIASGEYKLCSPAP